jgi:chromosome segregation ATPase
MKKKTWGFSGFKPFAKQGRSYIESDSESEQELARLGFNSIIESDSDDSLEIAASFKSGNSKEFTVQTIKTQNQAIKKASGIPVVKIKPKVDQRSGVISVPDNEPLKKSDRGAQKIATVNKNDSTSVEVKSQLFQDLKQLRDGLNSNQNNVIQSTQASDSTTINRNGNELDPDKSLHLNISIIESEISSDQISWVKPIDDIVDLKSKQIKEENLVSELNQKLKTSQDRISELESENEMVFSTFQTLRQEQSQYEEKIEELESMYLEVYNRARDAESTATMYLESYNRTREIESTIESISSEREELFNRCQNSENTINALGSERDELFILKETLIEDIKVINDRLEFVKKQENLQEKEFDLFGQKIQSQQKYIKQLEAENNALKMKLRVLIINIEVTI